MILPYYGHTGHTMATLARTVSRTFAFPLPSTPRPPPTYFSDCVDCVFFCEPDSQGEVTDIEVGWVCDGEPDCPKEDDEGDNCHFGFCDDGVTTIHTTYMCDGFPDCKDGMDEIDCWGKVGEGGTLACVVDLDQGFAVSLGAFDQLHFFFRKRNSWRPS